MKTTLTLAAMLAVSMAGNFYALNIAHKNGQALDACAKVQNVYACKAVAVPVDAPRVVEVSPALLPPPVLAQVEGR